MIYDKPIMPKFYFGPMPSTKGEKSDRGWIYSRMQAIPPDQQEAIAERYTDLYLMDRTFEGRDRANHYLKGKAQPFIDAIRAKHNAT